MRESLFLLNEMSKRKWVANQIAAFAEQGGCPGASEHVRKIYGQVSLFIMDGNISVFFCSFQTPKNVEFCLHVWRVTP